MFDSGSLVTGVVSGLITILISAATAAIWNWFSKEGLIHLLGGMSKKEVLEIKDEFSSDVEDLKRFLSQPVQPIKLQLKSGDSKIGSKITFLNNMDEAVVLNWFDHDGYPQRYETLQPKESCVRNTYATHPWVVKTASDSRPVHVVIGMQTDQTCEIGTHLPPTPARYTPI